MTTRARVLLTASTVAALGVAAACGGDDPAPAAETQTPPDGGDGRAPPPPPDGSAPDADGGCVERWVPQGTGPVLGFTRVTPDPPTFDLFNDPAVLEESGTLRMWLSNHDKALPPEYCCQGGVAQACQFPLPAGMEPKFRVRVFEATSNDGAAWSVVSAPRLGPDPGAWDGSRVETPVVIRVGARLHMYYTGNGDCEPEGRYAIGHAWSDDGGATWTKDPANPVVTMPPSIEELGGLGVAEPAVLHRNGSFWLYYTAAKCRVAGCAGPQPKAARALMRRVSADGSSFGPPEVVLTDLPGYPASGGYEGPSTPMVREDGAGLIHLYYDLFKADTPRNRQVAIGHATSADGASFVEVEKDLLTTTSAPWLAWEVRAPHVLDRGGKLSMWFAGNNGTDPSATGFTVGIGYATLETVCPR